jgi:hypothetical protein
MPGQVRSATNEYHLASRHCRRFCRLGIAIASGLFTQDRKSAVIRVGGAAIVTVLALVFVFLPAQQPTAPSVAPGQKGTQYDLPARPSDRNALPATPASAR